MHTTLTTADTEATGGEFVAAAKTVLNCAFGTDFDLLPAESAPADVAPGPQIEHLDGERYRVQIDLPASHGECWTATGEVATADPALLTRLTATVRTTLDTLARCADYDGQLHEFTQQMGDCLEEVSWSRRLSSHLHDCGVANSLSDVCRTVLPPLRDLIRAEMIAFIGARRRDAAVPPEDDVLMGLPVLPRDACRAFAERLAGQPQEHPVVLGSAVQPRPFDAPPGVRSAIVARISLPDCHYGWLVALNRLTAGSPQYAAWFSAVASETEFGTVEAGLLQATASVLASHARNVDLFRQQEQLTVGVIRTLTSAIDAKDRYTRGHSDRVARMAMRVAAEIGLSRTECERIYVSGLLHDVGKIGVPDHVLQKPGRLTDEEFALIKQHPQIGYDIIRPLPQLSYALPGVLHHHESLDGKGYPAQLQGDEIPLQARILAVVDAYDAMTSCRPYRQAMSFERAEAILQESAGRQWDADLVAAFFRARRDIHAICFHDAAKATDAPGALPQRTESGVWAEFMAQSDPHAGAAVGAWT